MKECNDCGGDIPHERLKAQPNARFCIECQELNERKGNFQKHMMDVNIRFKGEEIESMEETLVRGTM